MRNWLATKRREMADRIDGNTTFIASVGSVCTAPGGGGAGGDIRSFGIIGEPAKNYIGYTVGHDEGGRAGLSGPTNTKSAPLQPGDGLQWGRGARPCQ